MKNIPKVIVPFSFHLYSFKYMLYNSHFFGKRLFLSVNWCFTMKERYCPPAAHLNNDLNQYSIGYLNRSSNHQVMLSAQAWRLTRVRIAALLVNKGSRWTIWPEACFTYSRRLASWWLICSCCREFPAPYNTKEFLRQYPVPPNWPALNQKVLLFL